MNDRFNNKPEELDRCLRETLDATAPAAPDERMRAALRDFQARLADHPAVLKTEAMRRPRRAFPLWRWGVGLSLAGTLLVAGAWCYLYNLNPLPAPRQQRELASATRPEKA